MPKIVNSKDMQGVSVRTQSRQSVGKVSSLEFDAETGHLIALCVNVRFQKATIAWSQIISMSTEEVIVKDGTVPEKAVRWTHESRRASTSSKPLLS